jgi:modulator of FtsH protease HflC
VRRATGFGLAVALVVATLACHAVTPVGATEEAVFLRFGAPVRTANVDGRSPGLYLSWPVIEAVVRLDRRPEVLAGRLETLALADGSRITARGAFRYRITDPARFYRQIGPGQAGVERLQDALEASLARGLAGVAAPNLASEMPDRMAVALAALRREAAREQLGVVVQDVILLQLAPADMNLIGRTMLTEDQSRAASLRTEADTIKREQFASADREAAAVRGEGDRQALVIRGQGDAERAAILGAAYQHDPDFARFFRRLEAYDQALNPQTTTLVLSPQDNGFLDLFAHGPGAGSTRR